MIVKPYKLLSIYEPHPFKKGGYFRKINFTEKSFEKIKLMNIQMIEDIINKSNNPVNQETINVLEQIDEFEIKLKNGYYIIFSNDDNTNHFYLCQINKHKFKILWQYQGNFYTDQLLEWFTSVQIRFFLEQLYHLYWPNITSVKDIMIEMISKIYKLLKKPETDEKVTEPLL